MLMHVVRRRVRLSVVIMHRLIVATHRRRPALLGASCRRVNGLWSLLILLCTWVRRGCGRRSLVGCQGEGDRQMEQKERGRESRVSKRRRRRRKGPRIEQEARGIQLDLLSAEVQFQPQRDSVGQMPQKGVRFSSCHYACAPASLEQKTRRKGHSRYMMG